jgi:putative endonuclease
LTAPTTKGKRAEELARAYLEDHGYQIVLTNYRYRLGEIDIIAREGSVLCFVEVRSVKSKTFHDPLDTITSKKQARIIRAAQHYLASHETRADQLRFDVIGVTYNPSLEIRLVRGAFEAGFW